MVEVPAHGRLGCLDPAGASIRVVCLYEKLHLGFRIGVILGADVHALRQVMKFRGCRGEVRQRHSRPFITKEVPAQVHNVRVQTVENVLKQHDVKGKGAAERWLSAEWANNRSP